jgi:hypothetical protein
MRAAHSGSITVKLWLALQTAVWLCMVPVLVRTNSLPGLLDRLTIAPSTPSNINRLTTDCIVRVATLVSGLPLFRSWPFPRTCVRESLALAFALSRTGRPFEVHFGVRKEGQTLRGHSWITINREHNQRENRVFSTIYTYSFAGPAKKEIG